MGQIQIIYDTLNNEKIIEHNIKNISLWSAFWTSLTDLSIYEYHQLLQED